MLVREAMERFERGLVAQGASRNTVATYKRNLERFVKEFGEREVETITTSDLNDFLFSVGLKADGTEKTPGTTPHASFEPLSRTRSPSSTPL